MYFEVCVFNVLNVYHNVVNKLVITRPLNQAWIGIGIRIRSGWVSFAAVD